MYCTYHVLYVLRAVYVLRTMYCTYCVPRTVRTAYHVLYALRAACVLRAVVPQAAEEEADSDQSAMENALKGEM
jgi:hypothetical protein